MDTLEIGTLVHGFDVLESIPLDELSSYLP